MTTFKAGQRVFINDTATPHSLHAPEDWAALELHLNGTVIGQYAKGIYRVKRDSGRTENISADHLIPDNSSRYDNVVNIGAATVGLLVIISAILAIF